MKHFIKSPGCVDVLPLYPECERFPLGGTVGGMSADPLWIPDVVVLGRAPKETSTLKYFCFNRLNLSDYLYQKINKRQLRALGRSTVTH